ncbi:SRPBCC domain-containing protein [Tsukamurella tyrosinosolvens]|uniref:SRPBCC domain-containing protein n=1 Tax=Tsukamurella tyrosinosolvens TaxID=57704 RepID=UPI002DD439AE|nr:SRPBCC domain-containing protein [Tsukamurella tyrosinosolvens]MEC4615702.1 SRPBCC domain-containing protein [Tsukamurella tyrosinosolvens]
MKWILAIGGVIVLVVGLAAVLYRERTVERSVEIAAPPAEVWRVLVDFGAYPQWNPFVIRAAAPDGLEVGRDLDVRISNGGSETGFRPEVLAVEPERELRWVGRVLIPGLLDGEHYFRLEAVAGGTRFTQGERFRGVLVPVVGSALDVGGGFDAMNAALRDRVLATIAR